MKSYINNITGFGISCLFVMLSCEEILVEPAHEGSAGNFEYVWQKFDEHYGLFLVKNVNWDAVYSEHLPQANAAKTDAELFAVLSSMIRTLNDKHVNIYSTDPILRDYNSGYGGPLPAQEDFLFDVVKNNYLSEYDQLTEEIGYGKLLSGEGYIHLSAFKQELKKVKPVIDRVINTLKDTPAIIVDIRDHTGGDDRVSKYIAGRFANSKSRFMTTRKRNGPAHDNFDEAIEWYVEPTGNYQYTKAVVLLTSSRSISAAETFTLAMKENANVTQVGDTTAGAFSDQVFFEMPNGWLISVGVGDYRASDGNSYEGIGITPDVYVKNEKSELLAGTIRPWKKQSSY